MYWLKVVILVVFVALAMGGCSGLTDVRPLKDTRKKPIEVKVPPKREAPRELGSLWSDTSEWNDIYSETPNRVPGDVILVKLSERFRVQILRRLDREYPVRIKTKIEGVDKGKPELQAKIETQPSQIAADDTQQIYVTITEERPRHVYRVEGSETIRVGGREPLLTIQGEIRNRDIGSDDSISTDNLMNIAIELKPFGGERTVAADEAAGGNG